MPTVGIEKRSTRPSRLLAADRRRIGCFASKETSPLLSELLPEKAGGCSC